MSQGTTLFVLPVVIVAYDSTGALVHLVRWNDVAALRQGIAAVAAARASLARDMREATHFARDNEVAVHVVNSRASERDALAPATARACSRRRCGTLPQGQALGLPLS